MLRSRALILSCFLSSCLALLPATAGAACCVDASSNIDTIAGDGTLAYAGDGQPAFGHGLGVPCEIALGPDGSLYYSDANDNAVRKIDPNGILHTVAGGLGNGYGGDGGPANAATLSSPGSIAVAANGDVYIADSQNYRIRRVDASGIIQTVVGTGIFGYSGDGGPAAAAQIGFCSFMTLRPSGELVICDGSNAVIRQVSNSGVISTIAGTGTGGFSGDGGPATAAAVHYPESVVGDTAGNLYFWDDYNYRIRMIAPSGTISTAAFNGVHAYSGDGGACLAASSKDIHSLFICGGHLLAMDTEANALRQIDLGGQVNILNSLGFGFSGDGGPLSGAKFNLSAGMALGPQGDLYVSDTNNFRIRRISSGCTLTPTPTLTATPSPTVTASISPSPSASPTVSSTWSASPSPCVTPTLTVSPTATVTRSPLPSSTLSATPSATQTWTPTPPPLLLHPYAPNPDPAGPEGVHLPYWLQTAARVSIRVYTVAGEKVRDLTPYAAPAGISEEFWDGKNEAGTRVASGIFIVRIRADSPAGETRSAFERCAIVR